jgi:phytoene dehydrogenase-like protein
MYDAIVIGSGPNGLVAANLLADEGWSVLVLEADPDPGGAVRSAELGSPGFVHDLFSAFYPMAMASPAIRQLDLESHGLRWRHAPLVLAHPTGDAEPVVLSRDIEETIESLNRAHPGDGDRWRAMYGAWRGVGDEVMRALLLPFPPVGPGAAPAAA